MTEREFRMALSRIDNALWKLDDVICATIEDDDEEGVQLDLAIEDFNQAVKRVKLPVGDRIRRWIKGLFFQEKKEVDKPHEVCYKEKTYQSKQQTRQPKMEQDYPEDGYRLY
jgi:hypothetical protein